MSVVAVKLVLCGAGECDVHFLFPGLAACEESGTGVAFCIGSHNVVAGGTEFEHVVDFVGVETGGVVYIAVGAGDGHNLCAEFCSLEGRAPCHVAEAADCHGLALDVVVALLEHVLHEVEGAEAGSLRTYAAAAEFHCLAGECAVVLVDEAFVHTVHISYFASAHADVAGGYVAVRTEVLPEAEHEGLAEAHDFAVALATGGEVAAALCAAHRKGGECVFECLLEAQELENGKVYRSVEADTAFVRADGVVELHTVADVVLYFALVVDPCHAEGNYAVRLNHAFDDFVALELGVLVVDVLYRHKHFFHCLQVLFFAGVLGFEGSHDTVNIHSVFLLGVFSVEICLVLLSAKIATIPIQRCIL